MVQIPGGTFRIGFDWLCPEEQPVHQVTIQGF
jgi:formylglycine-generating enzyme required for sulfatase activity